MDVGLTDDPQIRSRLGRWLPSLLQGSAVHHARLVPGSLRSPPLSSTAVPLRKSSTGGAVLPPALGGATFALRLPSLPLLSSPRKAFVKVGAAIRGAQRSGEHSPVPAPRSRARPITQVFLLNHSLSPWKVRVLRNAPSLLEGQLGLSLSLLPARGTSDVAGFCRGRVVSTVSPLGKDLDRLHASRPQWQPAGPAEGRRLLRA